MPTPTLDIILVNRNSGHFLRQCLASVAEADRSNVVLSRVCVVDDASGDDSLAGVDGLGLPLQIIRNDRHRGYGTSCNLGAQGSKADYLLFLNTDTEVTRVAISLSVGYMERPDSTRVAIAGIRLLDDSGEIGRGCTRFPSLGGYFILVSGLNRLFPSIFPSYKMKEWDHLSTREVDHVIGAFMLMRRSVFVALGGYDERFFVYMEDLDLSLRTRALGFKTMYLAEPYAYHRGGGTAKKVWAESLFFSLRSYIQYGFKHFGRLKGFILALGVLTIEPFARLARSIVSRSLTDLKAVLIAYARLWRWVLVGR